MRKAGKHCDRRSVIQEFLKGLAGEQLPTPCKEAFCFQKPCHHCATACREGNPPLTSNDMSVCKICSHNTVSVGVQRQVSQVYYILHTYVSYSSSWSSIHTYYIRMYHGHECCASC